MSRPDGGPSKSFAGGAVRALYDNLELESPEWRERAPAFQTDPVTREAKALALDRAIRDVMKADWRGNTFKEREVRNAIRAELGDDEALVNTVFQIVKSQREY